MLVIENSLSESGNGELEMANGGRKNWNLVCWIYSALNALRRFFVARFSFCWFFTVGSFLFDILFRFIFTFLFLLSWACINNILHINIICFAYLARVHSVRISIDGILNIWTCKVSYIGITIAILSSVSWDSTERMHWSKIERGKIQYKICHHKMMRQAFDCFMASIFSILRSLLKLLVLFIETGCFYQQESVCVCVRWHKKKNKF